MSDNKGPRNRKPVPTSTGNSEKARQGMISQQYQDKTQ